jgi:hypothetical protein
MIHLEALMSLNLLFLKRLELDLVQGGLGFVFIQEEN